MPTCEGGVKGGVGGVGGGRREGAPGRAGWAGSWRLLRLLRLRKHAHLELSPAGLCDLERLVLHHPDGVGEAGVQGEGDLRARVGAARRPAGAAACAAIAQRQVGVGLDWIAAATAPGAALRGVLAAGAAQAWGRRPSG
jgi:hypothetical protein